jgi:hypothetical protein
MVNLIRRGVVIATVISNQYINTFFPDFADKHPFAFSDSLSRVASVEFRPGVATCLALDKVVEENEIFVAS